MTLFEFIAEWTGINNNPDIVAVFACVLGLVIFDNIVRFTLNIISSLFKKGSGSH